MHCSTGRLALCIIGVAALVIVVGLMCYYLPPSKGCPQIEEENTECQSPTLDTCLDLVKAHNICFTLPSCNVSEPWPKAASRPSNSSYLRLPPSLEPTHYTIELKPDFYYEDPVNFTLEGNVTITLLVKEVTDTITLHMRNIDVESVTVTNQNGWVELDVENTTMDSDLDFFIIILSEEVQADDTIMVYIQYAAPLLPDGVGLYYSSYYQDGTLKYMLGTQFEPLDARQAFPCLDEPHLKAKFNVTLWRKSSVVSLTNMPKYTSETSGEWIIEHFEETPVPYTTYLMAFAWADFDYMENTSENGLTNKLVRVWAAPDAKASGQLDYANQIAVTMFDEFENLFNIPFELPKLDKLPIRQFRFGAMENWGLVTYDDTRLLVHPNYTSQYDIQRFSRTMSHELVHMWIGNQVTCDWWDEIWLHESFARYFEFAGLPNGTPLNVNWDHIYFVQTWLRAFEIDENGQAKPVLASPRTQDELHSLFTSIIYDKGSAIITMMKQFLFKTEGDFIQAVQKYLRDNMYSNTNHLDLIEAWTPHLNSDVDIDFKTFLESWIKQTTHPVVTMALQGNSVQFSQNQFMIDARRPLKEIYEPPFEYKWVIPASFITKSSSNMRVKWLDRQDDTYNEPGLDGSGWILGNPGQFGLYRVNYDMDNWQKLLEQFEEDYEVISLENRAQLLADVFRLAKAGISPVTPDLAFNFTKYVASESQYLPWFSADKFFSNLDLVLQTTQHYGKFRIFMRNMVKQQYESLAWVDSDTEDLETKYLRTLILKWACYLQMDECVTKSTEYFNLWVNQGERSRTMIAPDHRETIGCTHLANRASEGDWDRLFAIYQDVKDVHKLERARIRNALACSRDQWKLINYASMAMESSELIHKDDISPVLQEVAHNPVTRGYMWTTINDKWDTMSSRRTILEALADHFFTDNNLSMLDSFFQMHPPSDSSEASAFERIRYKVEANIRWRDSIMNSNLNF